MARHPVVLQGSLLRALSNDVDMWPVSAANANPMTGLRRPDRPGNGDWSGEGGSGVAHLPQGWGSPEVRVGVRLQRVRPQPQQGETVGALLRVSSMSRSSEIVLLRSAEQAMPHSPMTPRTVRYSCTARSTLRSFTWYGGARRQRSRPGSWTAGGPVATRHRTRPWPGERPPSR